MTNPADRYGPNLLWFLDNLAQSDPEYIEDNCMEVYGEDAEGREGSCDIYLAELGEAAAATIRALQEVNADNLETIARQQQVIRMLRGDG